VFDDLIQFIYALIFYHLTDVISASLLRCNL
jgi:hypothetical protein